MSVRTAGALAGAASVTGFVLGALVATVVVVWVSVPSWVTRGRR